MANHRLFFAIDLMPEMKTQLLTFQQSITDIDGTPVPAENFHITLSFLGTVNEKKFESILDAIQPPKIAPFKIQLNDCILLAKSKVLALALLDPELKLLSLKKNIEKQLTETGFFQLEKREYIPHITLFRQVESSPNQLEKFERSLDVDHVCLMQSTDTRNGLRYQQIEEWPLIHSNIKSQLTGQF